MAGRLAQWVDGVVSAVAPAAAVRRAHHRAVLSFYEGAKKSPSRKTHRDTRGPNALVDQGAAAIRTQMRHYDRNHDITVGALNVLVVNTVGPSGIGVEFQPRRKDGSIHSEYAAALSKAYGEFCKRPEVTRAHTMAKCQRLAARTWFRDGEMFTQHLRGQVDYLKHAARVPLSLELLEPDLVPLDLNDPGKGLRQGIQLDAWGRKIGYHVYRAHPGEGTVLGTGLMADTKIIPAERMTHLAELARIGQVRGVSRFASVITRIEDLKDYEESERIAAKVAAMLTAYVKRQAPDGEGYTPAIDPKTGLAMPRDISLAPGTIIDTLAVGEEIGLIDSNRPNPNLVTFRLGQLRAFASGIGASFSTLAKSYEGTYSAQRQELVEQSILYALLTDDFVGMWLDPIVQDFIALANVSRVVPMPADVDALTNDDVLYIAPGMPWIDPAKEALGWLSLIEAGLGSEVEAIRKRGASPDNVIAQRAEWKAKLEKAGLPDLGAGAAAPAAQPAAPGQPAPSAARRSMAQALATARRAVAMQDGEWPAPGASGVPASYDAGTDKP